MSVESKAMIVGRKMMRYRERPSKSKLNAVMPRTHRVSTITALL